MATLDFLPRTTYRPPSPVQAHNRRRSLNTIMEDDEESNRGSVVREKERRGRDRSPKSAFLDTYLSPLSEHFPTPRGNNFMRANIPSSTSSETDSVSPAISSAPWTRDSFSTDATDFDDLYGLSDDEDYRQKSRIGGGLQRRSSARRSTASNRHSGSATNRLSLPALVIPTKEEQIWPSAAAAIKLMSSPIPPTPPPKVPMSPAYLSYLASKHEPMSSNPPSLDGSLTSEQLAAMSAPPTPDMGNDETEDNGDWGGGIQLEPAAMATLRALSGDDFEIHDNPSEQVIEVSQMSPTIEMQQSPPPMISTIRHHNSVVVSASDQRSLESLSRLEIPSPGGFFSSLAPAARHTWHLASISPSPAELHPPSSTTAEHFYKTPWSSMPVERIVEVNETMSDGIPTARPNPAVHVLNRPELSHQDSEETVTSLHVNDPYDYDFHEHEEELVATEILEEYGNSYVRKLQSNAGVNLDRTSMWLSAQSDYLSALINPPEERGDEVALLKREASVKNEHNSAAKKTVRFSENVSKKEAVPLPSKLAHKESAYYRAFQVFNAQSRFRDTFVHRLPRFEALQSQRVSFGSAHRAQLLGIYQLSVAPVTKQRRMSANVARGDEPAPIDPAKIKREQEREALEQMSGAAWNVMATRLLNGGKLLSAPIAKRLARLSSMGPTPSGRERARILDLGGQSTCDWAWYVATEFPCTKVYSVTTKALRQLSNSNIRGPWNHRRVAVANLWNLPFPDNSFDLVSARNLYAMLKVAAEHGEDEYDNCLEECFRVLKPGGYIEFWVMDSDLINAGPLGTAKSVEFGFNLRTRGYDAFPTRQWLTRLREAGFVGTKRAWSFLPVGTKDAVSGTGPSGSDEGVAPNEDLEGATRNVAEISGLVGSWAWEKWMLKLESESGKEEERLLDGVVAVLEEGRKQGSGWRVLSGWARKPVTSV